MTAVISRIMRPVRDNARVEGINLDKIVFLV